MNKSQKILLCIVMAAAIIVSAFLTVGYLTARREYSDLKTSLTASTETWRRINEEKLVVQKELKAVKDELRDAEMSLEEYADLVAEVEALEKEVEALKSGSVQPE